jgi:hypothetical protein
MAIVRFEMMNAAVGMFLIGYVAVTGFNVGAEKLPHNELRETQ